jgi:predicted outer membrane lipoprotein
MSSGVIAVLAGILTFAILTALALPHLETSLTFLPIFAISVLVGFVAPKVYDKIKNST